MSRRANPYDNTMAESFFSIFKCECIRIEKPTTFQKARLLVDEFIHFYNFERIQTETCLVPFQKRPLFT